MSGNKIRRGTMLARVSSEDIVIYANRSLASYLRVAKESLIGTPLEVLAGRCGGEMPGCFERPEGGRRSNRLVADEEGRVFEVRTYIEGGILDIVLDEVTDAEAITGNLSEATGTPIESLSEEELRTVRQPERRYLTIGHTVLREINGLAEKLPPSEVRLVVDSFLEEAADATLDAGCTVGGMAGESVMGLYGAPRYYLDHPLRAVKAACETMRKIAELHAGFKLQGKELPPCSVGLWTGEVLVGTLGSGVSRHFTALGFPVEFAERLARLARPGEILLPEHTLTHMLRVLPEGWTHLRAESESEPDLSAFQWSGEDVVPVAEDLRRVVFLVGPGVEEDPERAEYYFDYLWALHVAGREGATPILRVSRPSAVADGLELKADNVLVSAPAETLGKYKLLEILGTGGMGRVWRGVDRFGNTVAIKVLHSHDTISESQIRRFRREAEVMARLPHRNICRVYEMNEFEGIQYIAMEYVDGLSLADLLYGGSGSRTSTNQAARDLGTLIRSLREEKSIRDSAPVLPPDGGGEDLAPAEESTSRPKKTLVLPVQQTLTIILRVCEAIQFAHEHGVLHRDLKPGNILLREDGEPLVADFGLAKLSSSDATQSLSVSGHVVGTLENMPPEQAESSKDVDERADVYAIGTILFQMLTGHRHFQATGNLVTDAQALRTHEPPKLRSLNPKLDPDLEIITLKALRNNPDQRYHSVSALRADLDRYRRGELISAKPVSAVDLVRKLVNRNRAVTGVAAAALAVIAMTVIAAVWGLTQQLSREQAARLDAEEARSDAEHHKKLAEEKRVEAEAKEAQATQERRRAEALLAEKEAAEQAADVARARSKELQAETEVEREKRMAAEREASEKEGLLLTSQQQIAEMEASRRDRQERLQAHAPPSAALVPPARDREAILAAKRALGEALSIFNFELSPFELQRSERNPQRILERLSRALELVSAALLVDPTFAPGWMLKGRMHLAALEFPQAAAAFAHAATVGVENPGSLDTDDPAGMLALAEELQGRPGSALHTTSDSLRQSENGLDQTTGHVMAFFSATNPSFGASGFAESPTGRRPAPPELALGLMLVNSTDSPPEISTDPETGQPSTLKFDSDLPDLSLLRGAPITKIEARGTSSMDWESLATFPLESLDLSRSTLTALPNVSRAYTRLKSLSLADSHVATMHAARQMPQLESLDLSGSEVRDLSPLLACRRLRFLNISGGDRAGLRTLLSLPLETLTLSPLLISDKDSLYSLQYHRTLKVLRTPSDQENLAPAAFWQRLAAGDYNTAD